MPDRAVDQSAHFRVNVGTAQARVAIIFDYASAWAWDTQPQGADFDYFRLVFAAYRALRRLGLSIDILPPDTSDFAAYKLILAPGLATLGPGPTAALRAFSGHALLGPRTNAKTPEMAIPVPLPPNLPGLDATVTLVESLPPGVTVPLQTGNFVHWFEHLQGTADTALTTTDNRPAMLRAGNLFYLCGWPDDAAFAAILTDVCARADIETTPLPDGLRLRDTATHRFLFNYAPEPVGFDGHMIPPAGVLWLPL